MKSFKYKFLLIAIIAGAGCGEEHVFYNQYKAANEESTRVKFIHAASDTVGMNLFAGDLKISGAGFSVVAATGAVNVGRINYGADFPGTGYTSLDEVPGDLSVVFPETYAYVSNAPVTYAKKTMSTSNAALEAGSWKTVAFAGVYPTYETVVFDDDITAAPLDGKAYFRFVNLIHNSVELVDLEATKVTTPASTPVVIANDVAYKSITGFTAIEPGPYTFKILNGTTSANYPPSATASNVAITLVANKVYTFYSRGQVGLALTDAKRPLLSTMTNR